MGTTLSIQPLYLYITIPLCEQPVNTTLYRKYNFGKLYSYKMSFLSSISKRDSKALYELIILVCRRRFAL